MYGEYHCSLYSLTRPLNQDRKRSVKPSRQLNFGLLSSVPLYTPPNLIWILQCCFCEYFVPAGRELDGVGFVSNLEGQKRALVRNMLKQFPHLL
jgi:hypothetical protein